MSETATPAELPENVIDFSSARYTIQEEFEGETIVSCAVALPDGRVFSAETYRECERQILMSDYKGFVWLDMRGFWTSRQRWVRPRKALAIAQAASQIKVGKLKDKAYGLSPSDLGWPE